MPSIPLKKPADLAKYGDPANQAHLTIFFNTTTRTNEYLVVVFGTNLFGGIGELAHLPMPEDVFNKVAEHYPVARRSNLTRSEDMAVVEVQKLIAQYWPAEPEPSEAPEAN